MSSSWTNSPVSSEFVAFLDSDDIWPNDFLERAVAVISSDHNVVAASADRSYEDVSGDSGEQTDCRSLAKNPIEWIFRYGGGIASCSVFRRDAINNADGWKTKTLSAYDAMLFSTVATLGDWCHLAGEPVTFRHGNAAAKNEEANDSRKFSDSYRRWAISYEQIYDSLIDCIDEGRRRRLRRHIASYWYRAGKQLLLVGQQQVARECYDNAVRWRPMILRARIRRRRLELQNQA